MLLTSYRTYFINQLHEVTDAEEASILFFISLENVLKITKVSFFSQDISLNQVQVQQMNAVLEKLKKHQPIHYIFEEAYFYGRLFKVTPDTLIPRKETEELIEWMLETLPRQKKLQLLDIGTGSGCIPITLAKEEENWHVSTMDISESAIRVAQYNAKQHEVEVTFIHQDILTTEQLATYDVIVSNPPYVREVEKQEMLPNVLAYEPHLALFVSDEDPLLFYKKIITLAVQSLNKGGILFFEINQYLAQETLDLFQNTPFRTVELRNDMSDKPRMICALL